MDQLVHWDTNQVCQWLDQLGLSQYTPTFRKESVDGAVLFSLSEGELRQSYGLTEAHARLLQGELKVLEAAKTAPQALAHLIANDNPQGGAEGAAYLRQPAVAGVLGGMLERLLSHRPATARSVRSVLKEGLQRPPGLSDAACRTRLTVLRELEGFLTQQEADTEEDLYLKLAVWLKSRAPSSSGSGAANSAKFSDGIMTAGVSHYAGKQFFPKNYSPSEDIDTVLSTLVDRATTAEGVQMFHSRVKDTLLRDTRKAFARYEADKERREASVDYATFAPIFAYTMQLTEPVVWAVHTGTWTQLDDVTADLLEEVWRGAELPGKADFECGSLHVTLAPSDTCDGLHKGHLKGLHGTAVPVVRYENVRQEHWSSSVAWLLPPDNWGVIPDPPADELELRYSQEPRLSSPRVQEFVRACYQLKNRRQPNAQLTCRAAELLSAADGAAAGPRARFFQAVAVVTAPGRVQIPNALPAEELAQKFAVEEIAWSGREFLVNLSEGTMVAVDSSDQLVSLTRLSRSSAHQIFFEMNRVMRLCNPQTGLMAAELAVFRDLIWYVANALQSLPKGPLPEVLVYRGIQANLPAEIYSVGNVVNWAAFSSSSLDQGVAVGFASSGAPACVFSVAPQSCVDISALSRFCRERELLFPANSQFRVANVMSAEMAEILEKENLQLIELAELGRDELTDLQLRDMLRGAPNVAASLVLFQIVERRQVISANVAADARPAVVWEIHGVQGADRVIILPDDLTAALEAAHQRSAAEVELDLSSRRFYNMYFDGGMPTAVMAEPGEKASKITFHLDRMDVSGWSISGSSLKRTQFPAQRLLDGGAAFLTRPLALSPPLMQLSLHNNGISTDGALALLQAFASNRSLQRLDLAGNPIEPYALEALNFACQFNCTQAIAIPFFTREAQYPGVDSTAAECIRAALELPTDGSRSLTDVWDFAVRPVTAQIRGFVQALTITPWRSLTCGGWGDEPEFGTPQASLNIAEIIRGLRDNTHIDRLCVSSCGFQEPMGLAVAEVLSTNTTISRVSLHNSDLGDATARALVAAFRCNPGCKVRELFILNLNFSPELVEELQAVVAIENI